MMILFKKSTIIFAVLLIFSSSVFGKPETVVEVMYFKANLACCKARACNVLQTDIEEAVSKYFDKKIVPFKVIRLSNNDNKELVDRYNAKSQTVVIYNKKEDKAIDVTSIVNKYKRDRDKQQLANELKKKIDEVLES